MSNETRLDIAKGRDDAFLVECFGVDADGVAVAMVFNAGDTLDASVWLGGDTAEVFSPAATIEDGPNGVIRLTFAASQTASLPNGVYPLEVFVTPASTTQKIRCAEAWVKLLDSPGSSSSSLPVYCSYQDLRDYGGGEWLDQLRSSGTLANAIRERARARSWLDTIIVKHVRPWDPRGIYRRALGAFAIAPDAPDPTIAAKLLADALIVTDDVRECCAVKALAIVCRSRLTFEDADVWERRTAYFERQANRLVTNLVAQLDTNADGKADYALSLGVLSLR